MSENTFLRIIPALTFIRKRTPKTQKQLEASNRVMNLIHISTHTSYRPLRHASRFIYLGRRRMQSPASHLFHHIIQHASPGY
eukprot:27945-Eustigmatos_ZCMA.PRE.1